MPIITAALVPNLTLLVPGVGKENALAYPETLRAYHDLAKKLQDLEIETVVIISSRGSSVTSGLLINLLPSFDINFEEFADLATRFQVEADINSISILDQYLKNQLSLSLVSLNPLDYGTAVPLSFFLPKLPHLKVVPIYVSNQALSQQFVYGEKLLEALQQSPKRIALLASANLTHRLSKSPAGPLPKAKGYDKKIIHGLLKNDNQFLLSFSETEAKEYYEFGLSCLALLAGAISPMKKTTEVACYEHGLGLAVAIVNFDF